MESEFTESRSIRLDQVKPPEIPAPGSNREASVWSARLQKLRPSTSVQEATLSNSGVLNAQIWLAEMPWRPAAAWAMLAGLLSCGLFVRPLELAWPTVVLLLLLVDPLWGSLWRIAGGRAELLPLRENPAHSHVSLPYLKPGSPASKLLDRNTEEVLPVLFRVVFPGVLLTLLVASALGVVAVAATVVVLLLAGLGWISTRRAHRIPVFLHSLVGIGLPMLLAAWLVGDRSVAATAWIGTAWSGTAWTGDVQTKALSTAQVALIVLWTLHQWGAGRAVRFSNEQFGLLVLGIADIGMAILLLWVQAPLWLAIWLVAILPTWLLIYRRQPLRRAAAWQLLAMLVSAAGVGQSL